MPPVVTCPQGHRWESTTGTTTPTACPVCGQTVLVFPSLLTAPPDQPTFPPSAAPASVAAVGVPPPLPETFGRYRIRGVLGRGGMGAVYIAHDTQLDRGVALKVPFLAAAEKPAVLERFYREARLAATVMHPNVCPIYDVGEIDGIPYLTMGLLEGKLLADLIRPDRLLTAHQVAPLVRKVALALEAAHQKGVIHRDLKPSNIMIGRDSEPVVMDFGLARQVNQDRRITQVGAIVGTPAYLPPEQLSGNPDAVGPAADVYSLGVIMYELLTGRLPFEGSVASILTQIVSAEARPPSRVRAGVDLALETICRKAMARDPADRYPSMGELARALREYLLERTPGGATPPAPLIPAGGRPARTKKAWLVGGVSLGLALVGAGLVLRLGGRDGSEESKADPVPPVLAAGQGEPARPAAVPERKETPPREDHRRARPPRPRPRVLQTRTHAWGGSVQNFARGKGLTFDVGMGAKPDGVGIAEVGWEVANAREVRVEVQLSGTLHYFDENSFIGFMVDYHTGAGYRKRVALTAGLSSERKWSTNPVWGKRTKPDQFVDVGRGNVYHLDLRQWAPDGWNGQVWFTLTLQNSGSNTRLKGKISLPAPKLDS